MSVAIRRPQACSWPGSRARLPQPGGRGLCTPLLPTVFPSRSAPFLLPPFLLSLSCLRVGTGLPCSTPSSSPRLRPAPVPAAAPARGCAKLFGLIHCRFPKQRGPLLAVGVSGAPGKGGWPGLSFLVASLCHSTVWPRDSFVVGG